MIRTGLIGLGKMGTSHCSILNAHPEIDLVGICDSSKLMMSLLEEAGKIRCFSDYQKMIDECDLEAVVIATPTKIHFDMVTYALDRNLHVFVEKPFSLSSEEGTRMADLAESKNVVNQVGYHNRFLGTFIEAKRIIDSGAIGEIYHVLGESYGPVVLKDQGSTWRSQKGQGGGCLYDYASLVINLIQYIVGSPTHVGGAVLESIYSKHVDDAVYATLYYGKGMTGQLSVNWSDETYRKMSTQVTFLGKTGKVIADATEYKTYLRNDSIAKVVEKGWSIKYLTDLTLPVKFYLRGEEYSAQIDHYVDCIMNRCRTNRSSFRTALETDFVIEMLIRDATNEPRSKYSTPGSAVMSKPGFWRRLLNALSGA